MRRAALSLLLLLALGVVLARDALGAVVSNPANPANATSLAAGVIPGYLSGCTLSNNGTQALDVAACNARDGGDAVTLSTTAATTAKQLNNAWAVGSSAGCLDTGSITATTWYAIWAIIRTDTTVTDFLCSISFTNPTLPTNYTKSRRIGAVLTSGTSTIHVFTQDGDYFEWNTPTAIGLGVNVNNPGTAMATRTVAGVPVGISVRAVLNVAMVDAAVNGIYVSDPVTTETGNVASANTSPLGSATIPTAQVFEYMSAQVTVRTNTSGQIKTGVQTSNTNTTLYIQVIGWYDTRGK